MTGGMMLDQQSISQSQPLQSQQSIVQAPKTQPKYSNPKIDQLNSVIQAKQVHNDILAKELDALMKGDRQGFGSNGLQAIQEFEQLLQALPMEELKVIDPEKAKRIAKYEEFKKKGGNKGSTDNPMSFVQNMMRHEQLNPTERHLLNLQAQEYDSLKVLETFGKDAKPENKLYQFKAKQFADASQLRGESLKVLNEQNLMKIKHDYLSYGTQQEIESKKKEFEQMLERMKIAKELQNIAYAQPLPMPISGGQQQQSYSPRSIPQGPTGHSSREQLSPAQLQGVQNGTQGSSAFTKTRSSQRNSGSIHTSVDISASEIISSEETTFSEDQDYTAFHGFDIYWDFATHFFAQFDSVRVVFVIQNVTTQILDPLMVEGITATVDPTDSNMKYIGIDKSNLIKGIKAHPSCNLVIEVQVPKVNNYNDVTWVAYGWTIINLFDYKRDVNAGTWRLPLYQCPTLVQLDVRDINTLKPLQHSLLCFRLSNAKPDFDMDIKRFDPAEGERPFDYELPEIHDVEFKDAMSEAGSDASKKLDKMEDAVQDEVDQEAGYEGHSLTLKVHNIMNYAPASTTTIIVTLFQGPNIVRTFMQDECTFKTSTKDFGSVKEMPNFIPNDKRIGQYLHFGDQVHWDQNFYKLYQQGQDNKDLNLLIEIYESWIDGIDEEKDNQSEASVRNFLKKFNPQERRNQERLYAYASMTINHDNGTLKYGTYELNLFRPPVNLHRRLAKDQVMNKHVKITLQMPEHQDVDDMEEQEKKEYQEEMERKLEKELQVRPYVDSKINEIETKHEYKQPNGIDFYIDQARYLPDSCTISRLLIRGINNKQEKTLASTKAYPEISDSTRMVQVFDFRMEIRPENQIGETNNKMLDPTTLIEIIVETIDRSDMNEKIIGYAYFPLFLNKEGSNPPFESNAAQYIFNKGCYQIPIFYTKLPSTQRVSYSTLHKLPKISCATILVRSYQCPIDTRGKNISIDHNTKLLPHQLVERGIVQEAPGEYSQGYYNAEKTFTTIEEQALYKFKHKRINPEMKALVGYLFNKKGIQLKGKSVQVDEVLKQLDQLFGKASFNKAHLHKKYSHAYEPKYGFRVSIQRIHGLLSQQKGLVHFIVSQFVPPGRLLRQDPMMGPDVHVFKDQDFDSPWSSPQFIEEMNYVGLPGQDKVGIIFEVKAYNPTTRAIEDVQSVGWCFLPMFHAVENENKTFSLFCNSGLLQIPLFKGEVNKRKLIQALNTDEPMISLLQDRELQFLEPTSIIVRVHDNQLFLRAKHTEFSDLDTEYIPPQSSEKYLFNYALAQASKEKSLNSMHNMFNPRHLQAVKTAFELQYGFEYTKIKSD